jgi:hypothetical protein
MAAVISANALTTLEAVKQYVRVATTTDDDLIIQLINACSSAIENYCRRKFKGQTFTEDYDGTNHKYINLKNYPVSAVSTVSVDGTALNASGYVCKKETGVLVRKGGKWNEGDVNVTVTYTAGFATIPDDLELACKIYVNSIYKADVQSFSTTFNEGFVFRADSIPVQVKFMLQPYVDTSGGVR